VKPAATPLSFTALTSVKPEPAMVTLSPAAPLPGVNELSFGSTLNVPMLCPEPAPVTTVSFPVDASAGTTTVTFVGVTVAGTATTPLKSTLDAPPNAVPLIVTVAPTAAEEGVNPVTFGSTNRVAALVAVPPAVVTEIVPELAAAGTVSRTCSADSLVKDAATPFTFTEVTPPKPVPSTNTAVPAAALPGEKPVIVGTTVKFVRLVAVPPAVTTETFPVVAVAGTVAVIW
jgi:hypothetical protein